MLQGTSPPVGAGKSRVMSGIGGGSSSGEKKEYATAWDEVLALNCSPSTFNFLPSLLLFACLNCLPVSTVCLPQLFALN